MANRIDAVSGDLIVAGVSTLYDVGAAYDRACGYIDRYYIEVFRDERGRLDCQALAQSLLDGPPVVGAFCPDGFTWYRSAFGDKWWNALLEAFPPDS